MQVFEGKKSNSFHDSICRQWNECKKLTAKQLECIIKGFTVQENINFWIIWQQFTNDEITKKSIASWVEKSIYNFGEYIENEAVINCLLYNPIYKYGFHFLKDIDDKPEIFYIAENGKNDKYLNEHIEDKYIKVIKIVKGIQ